MDIHENEEQLDEIDPVSGDAQVPEENMEEILEASQVGEELQDAPPAEIAEEEGSIEAPEGDSEEESTLETEEEESTLETEEEESTLETEEEESTLETEKEESVEDDEIVLEGELPLEAEEDISSPEDEVVLEEEAVGEPDEDEPGQLPQAEEIAPDPYASVTIQEDSVKEPDDDRVWYVVHCYSGNEDKVRHNILQRIESMSMDDLIFDVVVPTEDEVNIKNGERQTVEKKVFPGYILVNMILTEESWYMVRNTPGVTGFVGMGNDPTPLQPEEVARILKRMESESPRINVTFRTGERVRIVDGPFEDFYGKVSEIDMDRATVRVMVNFFGRETPVELDFLQVEQA